MSRNQRRNRRNKPTSQNASRAGNRDSTEDAAGGAVGYRSSTETKSALKTTELIAYAGTVLAVIMTALALDEDGQGGNDPFGAESAIRYITYLTIGYMVARGLAKAGSHENRIEHDTDLADDNAVRTVVVDDEEGRDADAGERDGAAETAEPAGVPSEGAEHAVADKVDARP